MAFPLPKGFGRRIPKTGSTSLRPRRRFLTLFPFEKTFLSRLRPILPGWRRRWRTRKPRAGRPSKSRTVSPRFSETIKKPPRRRPEIRGAPGNPRFRIRSRLRWPRGRRQRKRTCRLRFFGNHFGESSEREEHADYRHDLRQIKEEDALERILGTVPKFSDEKDRCERRESEIAYEPVDLHERRAGDVEDDEVYETEERVDEREGYDRRGVRIGAFRIGIRNSEWKVRGFAVDLSADEGSEVSYDSREEEREHDRVQVFPQGEFVLLELVDEYEEETERSSRKGKVIVGSDEKPQKSFGNDVFEFG